MRSKFKREFVDGTYGQLHLRRVIPKRPTKRPLVCIHMLPQSGRSFVELLNESDDERVIVAPDLPGYGESDCPLEPIAASDYADSIWQVIDQLNLLDSHGSVDLFGIHAGAKLAVEVARQRSQAINKIVLASAAILTNEELEHLKSVFLPIELDPQGTRFKRLWEILVRNQGRKQSYQMMASAFSEMLRPGDNYEWGHYAVYQFNQIFPTILKSLETPIVLLNPKDDLYEMTKRTEAYLNNGVMIDCPHFEQGFLQTNAAELFELIAETLNER